MTTRNMTPPLTPTDQERGLIAILHDFDDLRETPEKGNETCTIVIKMNPPDHVDHEIDEEEEDEDDKEERILHSKIWWSVDLYISGFDADGEGATFAAAWDAMMENGDEMLKHLKAPKLSDLIRQWSESVTALSVQERNLLVNLQRRARLNNAYTLYLAVNVKGRPGEWEVFEETRVHGVGETFDAAWEERF